MPTVLSYTNAYPNGPFLQHLSGQTSTVQTYVYQGAVQPASTSPTVLSYTSAYSNSAFLQHLSGATSTVQSYTFPGAVFPLPNPSVISAILSASIYLRGSSTAILRAATALSLQVKVSSREFTFPKGATALSSWLRVAQNDRSAFAAATALSAKINVSQRSAQSPGFLAQLSTTIRSAFGNSIVPPSLGSILLSARIQVGSFLRNKLSFLSNSVFAVRPRLFGSERIPSLEGAKGTLNLKGSTSSPVLKGEFEN